MIYRPFGKTGEKISAIGFGCMRLPMAGDEVDEDKAIPMLRYGYERGINYFDTAPYYCNRKSEIALGKAVKPFRKDILLSTKLPGGDVKNTDDFWRFLERSLKNLDTDYIDFYHVWGTNKNAFQAEIVDRNILPEVQKAKEQGMIRHFSFSFHDAPPNIKYIIDTAEQHGVPLESMLVQYNLLDRGVEDMLAYAASKGLGTVAMGPVGGGRLAAPTAFSEQLAGDSGFTSYELAFRFVLGNPNMCCALSGMQTMEMVEQNVRIAESDRPLSEAAWKSLGDAVEKLKKFSDLYCTGCAYCQPCPAKINIPHIFNLFTHYNVYGLTEHAKNSFRHYVQNEHGATIKDCKNCGFCEKHCPQKLEIRKQLARVEEILTNL